MLKLAWNGHDFSLTDRRKKVVSPPCWGVNLQCLLSNIASHSCSLQLTWIYEAKFMGQNEIKHDLETEKQFFTSSLWFRKWKERWPREAAPYDAIYNTTHTTRSLCVWAFNFETATRFWNGFLSVFFFFFFALTCPPFSSVSIGSTFQLLLPTTTPSFPEEIVLEHVKGNWTQWNQRTTQHSFHFVHDKIIPCIK